MDFSEDTLLLLFEIVDVNHQHGQLGTGSLGALYLDANLRVVEIAVIHAGELVE